ncbi:DMT family transporter [Halobacillus salinarum]|uniref:DMT family transporter n=1 Tax=Halobacillus salinarum TaxID=2932257 RepID=A0ABY4EQ30_9BACI|nr:DMT family transporter [Halobacillus salinarum]UOQ46470.1 DMT family transporter [Halobacillus salinarum]
MKGVIFVLLGASFFGLTPIFVKTGFEYGYTLGQLNITQMLIAFFLLWGLSFVCIGKVKELSTRGVIKILITGSFVGLTSIFYYGAMQFLPASLAIILLFQFVWIGMIFEWIFTKIRPTKVNLLSMVITLTGVVFASNVVNGKITEMPGIGLFLGLLAGVTYAGFIFFSGQAAEGTPPLLRAALMITGAAILVFIIFYNDFSMVVTNDGRLWAVGAAIAAVGAILPPLLFAGGAPYITGRLANVLSSVELPVAIISAMIVLSERVTFLQWIGIILIISAIFVNELCGRFTKKSFTFTNMK